MLWSDDVYQPLIMQKMLGLTAPGPNTLHLTPQSNRRQETAIIGQQWQRYCGGEGSGAGGLEVTEGRVALQSVLHAAALTT